MIYLRFNFLSNCPPCVFFKGGKSSSGDDDDSHKSGGDVDVDSSDEDESNRSGTLINGVRNSYFTIQINDLLEI